MLATLRTVTVITFVTDLTLPLAVSVARPSSAVLTLRVRPPLATAIPRPFAGEQVPALVAFPRTTGLAFAQHAVTKLQGR